MNMVFYTCSPSMQYPSTIHLAPLTISVFFIFTGGVCRRGRGYKILDSLKNTA